MTTGAGNLLSYLKSVGGSAYLSNVGDDARVLQRCRQYTELVKAGLAFPICENGGYMTLR